jgi:O-acetyl-ADP-ribose deacetylase
VAPHKLGHGAKIAAKRGSWVEPIASYLAGQVNVVVGDIARQDADGIVNAANSTLLGGGGVDGAIHRAGGPAILEACREIRRIQHKDGLPTGAAVITPGGNLRARYVIHTVGPIYGRHHGKEPALLAACYRNSLILAAQHGLARVCFPAISMGVYGYPPHQAAAVSSRTISEFLTTDQIILEVRLVFFSQRDADTFLSHQRFPDG